MTDWLLFIIASLAVYRVARMVAEEDGPAFVFKRLRERFTNDKSSIAVGVRCFYCVSVWAAGLAAVLLMVVAGWDAWLWPIWWFGLAGLAAKLYEFWRRG
jgi:hypothetical protein